MNTYFVSVPLELCSILGWSVCVYSLLLSRKNFLKSFTDNFVILKLFRITINETRNIAVNGHKFLRTNTVSNICNFHLLLYYTLDVIVKDAFTC